MRDIKKYRLKKLYLHPIVSYLFLIFLTIILSKVLSLLNFQTTYNIINSSKLEQINIGIENLFSFAGFKYIISNASKNFMSFIPLSMFLMASIGIAVCEASGFFDMIFKKFFSKLESRYITFVIIFIGTISTLINEIGYVVLIPLAAIIYKNKHRNPIIGVVVAFASIAFGTATTIFVGSTEVSVIPYTTTSARLVDATYHISLLSNIFIMVVSSIVISLVGTIVVEKIIIPKLSKYRIKKNLDDSKELEVIADIPEVEQQILSNKYNENRGMKYAFVVAALVIVIFIYSVIPNLPFSGLLLDMNEETYLKQIFGSNSYFQDGFAYMISLLFLLTGITYGIGSKNFKNDKEVVNKSATCLEYIGGMIFLLFVASQFIAVVRKTNFSTIITGIMANFLSGLSFSGLPYLLIAIILIAVSNIFLTNITAKWIIFSPVIVPTLMQANISPQFSQFAMRVADSLTNGISPLYAYFVIYIGYLNVYNINKEKPITIMMGIKMLLPYFLIISITWLLLLLGWYIIGLPIGPGVFPTI